MSMMWRGPSAEVTASYSDPLAVAITRRCAKLGVFFNTSYDGRSAEVFGLRGNSKVPLGAVNGLDPIDTALRVAYDHTPFDSEQIQQRITFLTRKVENVIAEIRLHQRLGVELDELAELLGTINVRS
jgi:hypothetical protein